MKARPILTAAALFAAALFILDVPAAIATDYTWVGGNGANETERTEWERDGNWNVAGWPDGFDDTGTIPDVSEASGYNPVYRGTTDTTLEVGAVTIQEAAYLTVSSSATLTIQKDPTTSGILTINSGTPDGKLDIADGTVDLKSDVTHSIAGDINLTNASAVLAVSNDATFSGGGVIDGQNNSAQITIADEKTLINEITIEGALEIRGPGTFQNDGLVEAKYVNESGYILTLYSGTFSGGTSEACEGYKVADEEATLYVGATGSPDTDDMSAAFLIEDGTLDIEWIVVTSGGLRFIGGTISVDLNRSFTATGTPASCPP